MSLKELRKKIDERYKKESKAGKKYVVWDDIGQGIFRRHTGSFLLDEAFGGGLPAGICQLYGPRCIEENTFIQYDVWSRDGKIRKNHKGGSIKRLYERFHQTDAGGTGCGRHLQHHDVKFYVKSVNEENLVVRNEVLDVIQSGKKETVQVVVEDSSIDPIITTLEHRFLTETGYKSLSDLTTGDSVFVHNKTRVQTLAKRIPNRPEILVKYHPHAPVKVIDGKYIYCRVKKSRFAYEAHLNKMSEDAFRKFLNSRSKSEIQNLTFIPENLHVHHENENFLDDRIENLTLIDPVEHGKLHGEDVQRHRSLKHVAVLARIKSMERYGEVETYDISCAHPYNNYIANGFVVHNSGGKSALAQMIAGEVSKTASLLYCDAEYSVQDDYLKKTFGFDIRDEEKVILTQEQNLSDIYYMIETGIASGVKLFIMDSENATVTTAEENAEFGDAMMAQHARAHSFALPRLVGKLIDNDAHLIIISQVRNKIGTGPGGSGESTSGGNAIPHYSNLIARVSKSDWIKPKGSDEPTGQVIKIVVHKNKTAPPFKHGEITLRYNVGIDRHLELVDVAAERGFIEKSGAWYRLGDFKCQGKIAMADYLKLPENKDLFNNLMKGVISKADKLQEDKITSQPAAIKSEQVSNDKKSKKRKVK